MRRYTPVHSDVPPAKITIAPPLAEECLPIPARAKLVNHATAQQYLGENYQIKFAYSTFRQHCRDGKLKEGYHYRKIRPSGGVRFYLPNLEKFFGV